VSGELDALWKITMSDPVPLQQRTANLSRSGTFSRWSIASLLLLILGLAPAVYGAWFASQSSGSGPAEGAALTFVIALCALIALSCALLGSIFGWVGLRRSTKGRSFALAIAALNTTVCLLPVIGPFVWQIIIVWRRSE
jgi:hypothetical protein